MVDATFTEGWCILRLTLLLMLRNESRTIEDTLEHALQCADHVVIIDTGSTDNTLELAKLKLESWCGPTWEIHRREWIDYSWNRNEALGLANEYQQPDWIFFLDADCRLHGATELRVYLETLECLEERAPQIQEFTALKILVRSGIRNVEQTRVFRAGSDWRYVGVVHEVPVSPKGKQPDHPIPLVLIEHMGTDLSDKPRQWKEHARLLEKEIEKNPADARAWFYLGQSYELLDRLDDAREAYTNRWKMHGYWEERWEAGLRIACMCFEKEEWGAAQAMLCELVQIKPWRAEAWYYLARTYAELKEWQKAWCAALFGHVLLLPEHDHYFIQPEFYGTRTMLLFMVTCLYAGRVETADETYAVFRDTLTPEERIIFQQQKELAKNGGQEEGSEEEATGAGGAGAPGH